MFSETSVQKLLIQAASVFFILLLLIPFFGLLFELRNLSYSDISYISHHYAEPLYRTVSLALLTSVLVGFISLCLIFSIVSMHHRLWQKVMLFFLSLPLIFPPYIGAITYIDIFKSRFGLELFGRSASVEFGQAALVLALMLYPYTFLLLYQRLRQINPAHHKIISLYDLTFWKKYLTLYLPHLKNSLFSGLLLVFLYVCADFGAVSMLRMNTVTVELYRNIVYQFNYSVGAFITMLFVIGSLALIYTQNRLVTKKTVAHSLPTTIYISFNPFIRFALILFASIVITLAVLLPLGKILFWFYQYTTDTSPLKQVWIAAKSSTITVGFNSLLLSFFVTTSTLVLSLYSLISAERLLKRTHYYLAAILHALPAIVIAFAILTIKQGIISLNIFAGLFLLYAYIIRFLGIATISLKPALDAIPLSTKKIGNLFLTSQSNKLQLLIIPYIKQQFITSANYIFFNTIRELTIPLLLLPIGVELLSVRIWQTAGEGMYVYAAPSIIFLLLISLPSVIFYIKQQV